MINLVFLGFIFSTQKLQYEDKVFKQLWISTSDRDKTMKSSAYWKRIDFHDI